MLLAEYPLGAISLVRKCKYTSKMQFPKVNCKINYEQVGAIAGRRGIKANQARQFPI